MIKKNLSFLLVTFISLDERLAYILVRSPFKHCTIANTCKIRKYDFT